MYNLAWFRDRFPYTKLNDINLDWLLKRMKDLSALVVSYAADIQRALSQSSTAITQSETAVNSATNAVSIASSAAATADAVSGIAEDARTIASAANNTAIHAENVADGIAETAQSALDTAQDAETIANDAAQAVENALTTAQNAVAIANNANTRAGNAEQSALTAISTASAAQQTATSAAQDAETAQQAATAAAQDAETAQQTVTTIAINKADIIKETISANVASFPDGANGMPIDSLVVEIVPVQAAGSATPELPLPISGWTGCNATRTAKNLLPSDSNEYQNGIINSEGIEVEQNSYRFLKEYLPILPATVYSLSAKKNTTSNLALSVAFYDSDKNFLVRSIAWGPGATTGRVSGAVTSPQNAAYCRVNIWRSILSGEDYQYEIGSATDYEIYKGNNYDIIFPSPDPGTVYAGTLEWIGDNKWKLKARPYYASYNGETLVGPWLSSMDDYVPGTYPTTGAQVVDLGGVETQYIITVPNSDPTTFLGTNNIFANTGHVKTTYRADTKLYIQKINAPSDTDMTANTQISSGTYFIIGGNLYKSTTVIAQGDTIIPGSNCIETNLADALNNLI